MKVTDSMDLRGNLKSTPPSKGKRQTEDQQEEVDRDLEESRKGWRKNKIKAQSRIIYKRRGGGRGDDMVGGRATLRVVRAAFCKCLFIFHRAQRETGESLC